MKLLHFSLIVFMAGTVLPATAAGSYVSTRQEIHQAIARANRWLATQQKPEGYWDDPELPAITALALNAGLRDAGVKPAEPLPKHLDTGFTWLLAQQKENGGIFNRGLSVYNTAVSVSALTAANRSEYEPAIVKARKHLISQQWDLGKPKETDNLNDGGIGYGSKDDHTDLSNTYLAIEALALSNEVIADGKHGQQPDLDWKAALTFLSRCQNLESTNDQEWASDDAQNKGGFIYAPGQSKAGEEKREDGRTALRSYGSMSYAGLLSLVYAKVGKDDPRVEAVKEWLGANYTLTENPGMGAQGLFYYYQVMSKALTAAGVDKLKLKGGREADWREELANALLTRQREDGSWINDNGRWMESNPVLVTSYTVLALGQILDSIPQ